MASERKRGFAIKLETPTAGRTKKIFVEPKQLEGFCKTEPHLHIYLDIDKHRKATDKLYKAFKNKHQWTCWDGQKSHGHCHRGCCLF